MISKYENEQILQHAWIYIAIDIRNLNICKIGLTTKENPYDRIKQGATSNPYYILFNCYDLSKLNISLQELCDFEKYLHRKLGFRIKNVATGNNSEWLEITPFYAEKELEYRIGNSFRFGNDSFLDEDGEVDSNVMNEIKFTFRPDPLDFSCRSFLNYDDCKEYIDYLMDYHNYPDEPPDGYYSKNI